jgi:excisionase family DNA binding protein
MVYPPSYLPNESMKIITLPNGKKQKMHKPHEAASLLDYHPRTVRRLIHSGRIKAVDSNVGGKQPVWWISEEEIIRQKKLMVSVKVVSENKSKKTVTVKVKAKPHKKK